MEVAMNKSRNVVFIAIICIACCSTIGNNTVTEKKMESVDSVSPIKVKNDGIFITFTNHLHPNNRIGYQIFEHTPIVFGKVPRNLQEAGIDSSQLAKLEKEFSKRQEVLTVKHRINKEHWIRQDWTFYLAPAQDGIDILLLVDTFDKGLPSYYGIQQCFRMSGHTNSLWRQKIAKTPAFSEYDLWAKEKDQLYKTSLTWVRRNGEWQTLPAIKETVGARTQLGLLIDNKRTKGKLMGKVGPYEAKILEPVDDGLITRSNLEETWISGIFWGGTSHLTNHHPADCLHSIVNIGGIPSHSRRAVRGKIYWFRGTKMDLAKIFKRDFPK
jgi:hypothetical protein